MNKTFNVLDLKLDIVFTENAFIDLRKNGAFKNHLEVYLFSFGNVKKYRCLIY